MNMVTGPVVPSSGGELNHHDVAAAIAVDVSNKEAIPVGCRVVPPPTRPEVGVWPGLLARILPAEVPVAIREEDVEDRFVEAACRVATFPADQDQVAAAIAIEVGRKPPVGDIEPTSLPQRV